MCFLENEVFKEKIPKSVTMDCKLHVYEREVAAMEESVV